MAVASFDGRFWRRLIAEALAFVAVLAFAGSLSAQEPARPPLTFTKDVAPILQAKCEVCHRPDSIGPMSLVSFEQTRPWAKAIKLRVGSREMPPWHIDQTVGIKQFKNDRSLSDAEIDTIVRWVDSGAPKGDPKDMPAPKQWPDESVWLFADQFGPPDLVIKSPAYTVAAEAQDAWYKPTVETGLTERRWVRAIEIKPSTVKGRRITHHALARLLQEEGEPQTANATRADDSAVGPGLFMEWAVGKQGEIMRPNTGKLLLPGAKIVWDIHYHAVGEEITDSVELGIYLYPKDYEPKYRQVLASLSAYTAGTNSLDIPPNSVAVTQNFHVMKQAGRVENFQPHMHLRGKAMSMEAILPNGTRQMLSHVHNFQFNWHNNYIYADDAAPIFPKGTLLRITAWHDNTVANRSNPDPNQWVGYGDRTVDEMAHAWVNITYMSDEDYKLELEKKKATETRTTTQQQP